MKVNVEKYEEIHSLLLSKSQTLQYTDEDTKLIIKLWDKYCGKKAASFSSSSDVLAAAVLWTYARLNFLWEENKSWAQQNIAKMFNVVPKTISAKATQINNLLDIEHFDDRFSRKEIAEKNPLKNMVMLESGFILPRDMAVNKGLPHVPLKKSKEDYYYHGQELIGEDDAKAMSCFKKAIEMDDEYVDAYNGLGSIYFYKKPAKAMEYFQIACKLALEYLQKKKLNSIEWGIAKNRQYLRALHGYGLLLWRENKNSEALEVFKNMISLNPVDNQGIRYVVAALFKGLSWEEYSKIEDKCTELADYDEQEKLFEEQNIIHKFFEWDEE